MNQMSYLYIDNFQHEYFRQNSNFNENFCVQFFSLKIFFAKKFLFVTHSQFVRILNHFLDKIELNGSPW